MLKVSENMFIVGQWSGALVWLHNNSFHYSSTTEQFIVNFRVETTPYQIQLSY